MRTWRIAFEDVALDRSCEGARKSGGHWHSEGCAALYAAMTVELAVLEKFVHTEKDEQGLVLVAVDLPDGWDDLDDGGSATAFGTAFLQKCHHLYMRVPSVIVGEGINLIVNPEHPAYADVKLSIARSYRFDPRMFNRPK